MHTVPDPCYNLDIITYGHSGDPAFQSTDVYIGRWPAVKPSDKHLVWSNFFWGNKNITLSAYDPAFRGGYSCGPEQNSLCVYYISFVPFCDSGHTAADFVLTYTVKATLHRAHAIFGTPQTNQLITTSGGSKQYQFCVSESSNVVAQLQSFQDTCSATSNPYTWLDMVISPDATAPTMNQLVWRMRHGQTPRNYIPLFTNLPNFRTGAFYVSVIGSCDSGATTCAMDDCSCGSCKTLKNNSFNLLVDWADLTSSPTAIPTISPTTGKFITATLQLGISSQIVTASCSKYTYFKVNAVHACKDLKIAVTATSGSVDLFVMKSDEVPIYPTSDMLSWASFGNSELLISHWDPEYNKGTYYIAAYVDCGQVVLPASFTIMASEATDDSNDLYQTDYWQQSLTVKSNQHSYFRFCIPDDCANFTLSAYPACEDPAYCPYSYVWPDVILSRTKRYPLVKGNVYHGWTVPIEPSVQDFSIRDKNGFISGTYYGAVFGWCTYAPYCSDNTNSSCGPCSNYGPHGQTVNVTLWVNSCT